MIEFDEKKDRLKRGLATAGILLTIGLVPVIGNKIEKSKNNSISNERVLNNNDENKDLNSYKAEPTKEVQEKEYVSPEYIINKDENDIYDITIKDYVPATVYKNENGTTTYVAPVGYALEGKMGVKTSYYNAFYLANGKLLVYTEVNETITLPATVQTTTYYNENGEEITSKVYVCKNGGMLVGENEVITNNHRIYIEGELKEDIDGAIYEQYGLVRKSNN